MKPKQISRYIYFGMVIRYLKDAKEGWSVHKENTILVCIISLFSYLKEFNLPVTQRAAYELEKIRDDLAKTDKDHVLTGEEASKLSKIVVDLESTLVAEAGGNMAFVVTDKRIDINKLLGDVPSAKVSRFQSTSGHTISGVPRRQSFDT